MCVSLPTKFQVSSIILTRFGQGEGIILTAHHPKKRSPKKPTLIKVKNNTIKISNP